MKFNYPELKTETIDGLRWYISPDGKVFPSITTVLGRTISAETTRALNDWRNSLGHEKADAHSRARADHGTVVHLLAERYLKKQDVDAPIHGKSVSPDDKSAFNALKLKLDKIEEIWGQECTVYSNLLGVGGRCDLIGVYKGRPVIIDFKTSGRIKNNADIHDYKLQLAFYGFAHNELFETEIEEGVVLMVAENGFPLEFNFKLGEFIEPLEKRIKQFWLTGVNTLN